jgi:hypothetical protein
MFGLDAADAGRGVPMAVLILGEGKENRAEDVVGERCSVDDDAFEDDSIEKRGDGETNAMTIQRLFLLQ